MKASVTAGKIGIIAGAGPEAGIDLWQKILNHNKALHGENFAGDLSAPEVFVHSLPPLGLAMNIQENEDALWHHLSGALETISAQADFVCIACNILHYFSDRIHQLNLPATFVSIVDVTENYIDSHGNIALLSIGKVIEFGHYSPYRRSAEKYTIETPDQESMNTLVSNIKHNGGNDTQSIAMFEAVLSELNANNIILACTDLPLLPLHQFSRNFVDASDLLAQEVARLAFEFDRSPV